MKYKGITIKYNAERRTHRYECACGKTAQTEGGVKAHITKCHTNFESKRWANKRPPEYMI